MSLLSLTTYTLSLSLYGCTTIYNPATQRQETVLDSSVEIALGNLARAQMGLTSLRIGRVDPRELDRVQEIGRRIAAVSDRQDISYRFGVIREKTVNAFTLPGGTIYVHTGVLDKATEDELAAVIAHEVGHVAARHVAKHLQADLGFAVAMHLAQAAGVGAESAEIADSLYTLFSSGFSRRDELEADRLAIGYTQRAGYDPEGIVSFFEKMLKEEPGHSADRALVWRSTHPLTSERIKQAKEELKKTAAKKFCPECGRTYLEPFQYCERDGTALKTLQKGNP